jgi:hypothetical protein
LKVRRTSDYQNEKQNTTQFRKTARFLRLILADLEANRQPVSITESDEHQYGELTLEKVVITTRSLGRIWGAQVLCLVDKSSTSTCKHCGTTIAPVKIGSLMFDAEVERQFGDLQFIVNLVADHDCTSEEGGRDERTR